MIHTLTFHVVTTKYTPIHIFRKYCSQYTQRGRTVEQWLMAQCVPRDDV